MERASVTGPDEDNIMAMHNDHQISSRRSLHILDFPNEILYAIIDAMDKTPLRYYHTRSDMSSNPVINFRMTCKRFCDIASHLLVRSVKVNFTEASISHLEEISEHPTISKGIQVVEVYLTFFSRELSQSFKMFVKHFAKGLLEHMEIEYGTQSNYGGRRAWLEGLWEAKNVQKSWNRILKPKRARKLDPWEFDDDDSPLDKEEDAAHSILLKEAHRDYQRLYAEQEAIRKNGKLVQAVAAAMARMPNARTLDIADVPSQFPREIHWNIPTRPGVGVYEAYYKVMREPMSGHQANRRDLEPTNLYPTLIQFPLAVHRARVFLDSFKVVAVGMKNSNDLLSNAKTREELTSAMQRLKEFRFRGSPLIEYSRGQPEMTEHLDGFLKSCINTSSLEDLDLDPCGRDAPHMMDEDEDMYELPFVCLAPELHISRKKLRSVNLWGAKFRSDEMISLLSSLPSKMESLFLSDVRLTHGTWEEVLDAMRKKTYVSNDGGDGLFLADLRGGEITNMLHVHKEMIFEKGEFDETNTVEDYVLRILRRNPLTELRLGRFDPDQPFGSEEDDEDEYETEEEDGSDSDMPDLVD